MATVAFAACAVSTALEVTVDASWAFEAIDWIVEVISAAPVETLSRFWLTCCADWDTVPAWAEVSSEFAEICWLVADNSSLALATCPAVSAIDCTTSCRLFFIAFSASMASPTSSFARISRSSTVRFFFAMTAANAAHCSTG